MGRPTKFTEAKTKLILKLVREGNFVSTAARAARVDPHTVGEWVKRGKAEGEGPFYKFSTALEEAEAHAEIDAVAEWRKKGTPESIKEYLRRRYQHWNVPDKREVKEERTEEISIIDARKAEFIARAVKQLTDGHGLLRDGNSEPIHTDRADGETETISNE